MLDAVMFEEVSVEECFWQEAPTEEEMEEMFLEAINEEFQEILQSIREDYEAHWALAA